MLVSQKQHQNQAKSGQNEARGIITLQTLNLPPYEQQSRNTTRNKGF